MATSPEGSSSSSSSTQEKTRPRARGTLLGRGLACVRCRKRKQRCDGKQPECSSCTLVSEGCVYERIERPKRQPRATAGEGLKAKLARLEQQYSNMISGSSSSQFSSQRDDVTSSSPLSRRSTCSTGSDSSLDATAPTHDRLLNALLVEDMPAEDRNKVIHIFFTGSQRLGCPLLEKRFFERLNSEDRSQHPHPALVHAMLLVGQAFTLWTPGYSTAQKHDLPLTTPSPKDLLAKTQAYLADSLSNVDRMLDYLQASILLSYYFFQSGRLEEGQVMSAANSGMTVVCKLNMIDQSVLDEMRPGNAPPPGQSFWDGSLLGRPADTYELGVRLWTFWQSWYYDAVFSLVSGTPLKRDPTMPTTVFPRPSAAYESGLALQLTNTSFKELFENDPPQFPSLEEEPEGASHPLATYLKGCAIMQRSNQFLVAFNAGTPIEGVDFTPDMLQKLHASLQCLLQERLPIRKAEMLLDTPLPKVDACKIYCALAERIVGHIYLHTATLQLCRLSRAMVLGSSPSSQNRILGSIRQIEINAARGAAQALKLFSEEVLKLDARMRGIPGTVTSVVEEVQEHPCLMLGFLLTSVCMVLIDEIQELEEASQTELCLLTKASAEADLARCLAAIERTASSFPLLKVQAKKVRDYRDRRSEVFNQSPGWEYERRAVLPNQRNF